MRNKEVADHLSLVAKLLALDGVTKFRVMAFENAAQSVSRMTDPIEDAEDPSVLPGIGESTGSEIRQFLETGSSDRLRDLGSRWPVEAMALTVVDGVGPKTAVKLHGEGYRTLGDLVAAARSGTLKERLARAVLAAEDRRVRAASGRVVHSTAKYLAQSALDLFKHCAREAVVCGSVRRKAPDSKDVDVVATPAFGMDRARLIDAFCAIGEVINRGDRKASVRFSRFGVTMQVDLWAVEEWYLGSALVYATGSKDHCVALRTLAKSRGLTLNEYGLFPADAPEFTRDRQVAPSETEEQVYESLGLPYVLPELRTGDLPCPKKQAR